MSGQGHKHTAESRAKISATKMGHATSPAARAKMSVAKLGKPLSLEHRAKLSVVQGRGEQNHSWRGGRDAGLARRRAKNATPELREQARFYRIQRLYGLSQGAYAAMLTGQGGRCAACGTTDWGTGPVVDHDHETGNIRGILCPKCNLAAGLMGDSSARVRELAEYLERTKQSKENEDAT